MKKILFVIAVITTVVSAKIEITPFGGILFNGQSEFVEGNLDFENSGDYGVFINYLLPKGNAVELHWTQSKSKVKWNPNPGYTGIIFGDSVEVYTNYWQIGSLKSFGASKLFLPFVNADIGATMYSTKDREIDNSIFFSLAVGAGFKVALGKHFGVRAGGRFLIPLSFDGGGISFGTGGGTVAAYGNVPVLQGDLYGGLTINLGK